MLSQQLEDEVEHGVVDNINLFNVRRIIFMVAESWNQVATRTLGKYWKKLRSSV